MAAVTVDSSRHFGRLGLGGVLGSKNLKAIVISGGKYWKIDKKAEYNKVYNRLYKEVVSSDSMKKYHDLGTPINVVPLSKINGLPTRNFSQGFFEGASDISGETFAEKNLSQQIACAHCQCGCIHMGTVREQFSEDDHMYKTFKVSYDHELIFAWGSNLSIRNSDEVLKLLYKVEKQGWDSIGIGVTLAWAVEAFQKGYVTPEQTDGISLNFGDSISYLKVLERITEGYNEFYQDLEKGAAYCAEKYGGKEFAIAFGKNEAPGYMTGLHAFLGYATGVRHSHLDSAGYSIDQKRINSEKTDDDWTREMYKESVWRMVLNSLVVCLFARNIYNTETVLEALNALGIEGWTEEKLWSFAKKIHAMKNKYKMDCGFKFSELYFPERLEKVQTTNGMITSKRFKEQVKLYESLVQEDIDTLKS
jgi:aldehyde:ferredoxin oxidoreductase